MRATNCFAIHERVDLKRWVFPAGVAFNGDGRHISGMGADFRDYDGDGRPDIVMTGLRRETFELFRNVDGQEFADVERRKRAPALEPTVERLELCLCRFRQRRSAGFLCCQW